jgi:hypothetical protein
MNPKKPRPICVQCGIECKNIRGKYCSAVCQMKFQRERYLERWKAGKESGYMGKWRPSEHIRWFLHEKFSDACSQCGWSKINQYTGKVPLQIEHKDGSYLNMTENNLELLCGSCHTLTPTWGARNKGNGRPRY